VAGMAGTTFGSAILFCRSITIKAKGWRLSQEKQAHNDAVISVVMMFVLSITIMICAAGTLFVISKPVEDTVDMVRTLEPLAGRFANSLFIIGVVGAGLSSLIPTILIAPWLISDYTNSGINPSSRISRLFVSIGVLISLVGPYINTKPVFLMIITMALLAVILPFSIISITILLNQKYIGEYKNSVIMNFACIGAIVFSIIMSYYGVIGLLEYFR
jgi:Mn2+/Fe2+ NRAMP family transporter